MPAVASIIASTSQVRDLWQVFKTDQTALDLFERVVDAAMLVEEREAVELGADDRDLEVVAAAGPVLDALTAVTLREVFGVNATTARHADGVVRITYHAQFLFEIE